MQLTRESTTNKWFEIDFYGPHQVESTEEDIARGMLHVWQCYSHVLTGAWKILVVNPANIMLAVVVAQNSASEDTAFHCHHWQTRSCTKCRGSWTEHVHLYINRYLSRDFIEDKCFSFTELAFINKHFGNYSHISAKLFVSIYSIK